MRIWLVRWLRVAIRWKSQCPPPFPRQVWYQLASAGGMGGLPDLCGKFEPRIWYLMHTMAHASSDSAPRSPPPLTCCFLRILLSSHYGTKTTVSNACLMLNWRAPQKSRAKGMQTVSQLNSLPSRMAQRGREFVVIWIWTVVPVSQRFQQRMKMLLTNEVLSTHNNRRKKAWNSERCSPLWSSIHLHSAVFVPSASTTKSSALDTLECEKTTYCHLSVSPARKEETHWYR